jgi:hypothetical protein
VRLLRLGLTWRVVELTPYFVSHGKFSPDHSWDPSPSALSSSESLEPSSIGCRPSGIVLCPPVQSECPFRAAGPVGAPGVSLAQQTQNCCQVCLYPVGGVASPWQAVVTSLISWPSLQMAAWSTGGQCWLSFPRLCVGGPEVTSHTWGRGEPLSTLRPGGLWFTHEAAGVPHLAPARGPAAGLGGDRLAKV